MPIGLLRGGQAGNARLGSLEADRLAVVLEREYHNVAATVADVDIVEQVAHRQDRSVGLDFLEEGAGL